MPYEMIVSREDGSEMPVFEKTLGSGVVLEAYWEAVGRKLLLPMISSLTERASARGAFVIAGAEIGEFKREIGELERFWKERDGVHAGLCVPEDFFQNLEEISNAMDLALENNLKVMIA